MITIIKILGYPCFMAGLYFFLQSDCAHGTCNTQENGVILLTLLINTFAYYVLFLKD